MYEVTVQLLFWKKKKLNIKMREKDIVKEQNWYINKIMIGISCTEFLCERSQIPFVYIRMSQFLVTFPI